MKDMHMYHKISLRGILSQHDIFCMVFAYWKHYIIGYSYTCRGIVILMWQLYELANCFD